MITWRDTSSARSTVGGNSRCAARTFETGAAGSAAQVGADAATSNAKRSNAGRRTNGVSLAVIEPYLMRLRERTSRINRFPKETAGDALSVRSCERQRVDGSKFEVRSSQFGVRSSARAR